MRNKSVNRMVKMGLLCAIAIILVYLIRFPLIPSLSFLEYDMADVPILIGTFMYGPVAGLCMTAVVSVMQWQLVSPQSGWIGALMHFLATGGFVMVAGVIYRMRHTRKGALAALGCGAITMIAIMVPLNYYISPMFLQSDTMSYAAAQGMIWSAMWLFVAFNAAKAGINSVVTFLLYKAVSRTLKKEFAGKGRIGIDAGEDKHNGETGEKPQS